MCDHAYVLEISGAVLGSWSCDLPKRYITGCVVTLIGRTYNEAMRSGT